MIKIPDNIKGLIFDCDGTLADTMPIHLDAWRKTIESVGRKFELDFFNSMKGTSTKEIIRHFNNRYDDELKLEEVVDIKADHTTENLKTAQPFEPIVDIVHHYKDKLPMAVASGGRKENVETVLESLNIKDFFVTIITSTDGYNPKPEPDIFLKCAERMDVKPEDCLVFEDGDFGIQAAQKAGMHYYDVRPITGQV
jgi:beta-phosphoglucomutase family hydrolase